MRRTSLVVLLLLVTAACGGGDDTTSDPSASDGATSSPEDAPDDPAPADDGDDPAPADGDAEPTDDMTDDAAMGASYADITVDGTTVRYVASDVTYSPIEGVEDVTFEECNPSFFGAGFWVIGYPLDADGSLHVVDELGNLAGGMTALFPFADTTPDLMEFEFAIAYDPLGIDARYRPGEGPEPTYSFDGSRVTGTVVLDNLNTDPIEVGFDIVCAG